MSTDGYGFYYHQNEHPVRGSTGEGVTGISDNNIGSGDFIGPTVLPYNDGTWAEPKISNKNYNVQTNEIKYAPRKDAYRSMSRRAISEKMKHNAGYVETSIDNGRRVLFVTTIEPIDDDRMSEFENNGNVRAKR